MYTLLAKAKGELRQRGFSALMGKVGHYVWCRVCPLRREFYLVRDLGTIDEARRGETQQQLRDCGMELSIAQDPETKRRAVDWLRSVDRAWAELAEKHLSTEAACALGWINGERCYIAWAYDLRHAPKVPDCVVASLEQPAAYICGVYVPLSHRGRSIATTMGTALLGWLADQGWRQAVVGIRHDNVPSLRAHLNQGFVAVAWVARGRLPGTRWYERVSTDPAKVERLWQRAIKRT